MWRCAPPPLSARLALSPATSASTPGEPGGLSVIAPQVVAAWRVCSFCRDRSIPASCVGIAGYRPPRGRFGSTKLNPTRSKGSILVLVGNCSVCRERTVVPAGSSQSGTSKYKTNGAIQIGVTVYVSLRFAAPYDTYDTTYPTWRSAFSSSSVAFSSSSIWLHSSTS